MYNAFTYYVCLLMYKLQLCSSFCHKLSVVARQPGTVLQRYVVGGPVVLVNNASAVSDS